MLQVESRGAGQQRADAAAARILGSELRFIKNAVASGDKTQLLKSLDERGTGEELVQKEYGGRYVFELLQNANDAASAKSVHGSSHRVAFALTRTSLIVANEGSGFGPDNVRSICSLGRSSKDPRKSIGYKGLGFKAVGEISDQPQLFSPPHGFCFSTERVRKAVADLAGPLPPGQRLPFYAFPFPQKLSALRQDREHVTKLIEDGFVTVIRLPLRQGLDWRQVLTDIRSVISPELLLFLDATTEITISWPEGEDRLIKTDAEPRGAGTVVEIGRNAEPVTKWLLFRSSPIRLPSTQLVEGLDRSWSRVRQASVAVAFPLDGDALATGQPTRPVSVYFPTETHTGHAFLLNGDFYLSLDRRHVSETPQSLPYNDWLAERTATFFSKTVAPELARIWPNDYRVVHACAPTGSPSGFGARISELVQSDLRDCSFVPTFSGPTSPKKALFAPVAPAASQTFRRFFSPSKIRTIPGSLVLAEVDRDQVSREFAQKLGGQVISDDVIVTSLRRTPTIEPKELADFYALLDRWIIHHPETRRPALVGRLKQCKLLATFDGKWVSAEGPVFFPRQNASFEMPTQFPGNVLAPEATAGPDEATDFLRKLGVQTFRWREIILTGLLPVLREKPTEAQIRAAHEFLHAYFREEHGGDQSITSEVGIVPVRVRGSRKRGISWRPAEKAYFGRAWNNVHVEDLYGPLGEEEFLAEPVPEEPFAQALERDYYSWLGVADKPRLQSYRVQVGSWEPERPGSATIISRWKGYTRAIAEQVVDPQRHPYSQFLRTHLFDRLDGLLEHPTTKQGSALLDLLMAHWETFGPAMDAEIRCENSQHKGERARPVPSYIRFLLRGSQWVPARIGGSVRLLAPGEVWLTGADVPKRLGQLLPQVTVEGLESIASALVARLGFVDPAQAVTEDYVKILRIVPKEFPLPHPSAVRNARRRQAYNDQTADLCRWIMRNLNDGLSDAAGPPSDLKAWSDIPLLSHRGGELTFAPQPVVSDDGRLARRLGNRFPWFAGDKNWNRLISAFKLRRVSDIASIEAIPGDPVDAATRDLERSLIEARPYILALIDAEAPSELLQSRRRLDRLSVSVVRSLTVHVTVRDTVADEIMLTEDAFLKQAVLPGSGPIRVATGTYYCAENAVRDHYRFGIAVAEFLGRPGLGDAFAILFDRGRSARLQFLAAKGIDEQHVRRMREYLGQEDEEEADAIILGGAKRPETEATGQGTTPPPPGPRPNPNASGNSTSTWAPGQSPQRHTVPELPPLNVAGLTIIDAPNGTLRPAPPAGGGSGGGGGGGAGRHPDWETMEATRRLYGRRAEEAAYHAERQRIEDAGLDPDSVRWISRDNEVADHDLESVDVDGDVLYIEVKGTVSSDPGEPFPITSAELRFAAQHRQKYLLYRVTKVREPSPVVTRYRDPIGLWEEGRADTEVMQARMWLEHPTSDP